MNVIDIHGLSSEGDGVGRLNDGRVAFVPGGFPGDRVTARLTDENRRTLQAECVDRIIDSPDRVEPFCKRAHCGGCIWRGLSIEAQRRHKRDRVLETLRRIGGVDLTDRIEPINAVEATRGYRHRVRLQAHHRDDHWQFGFFQRRSHQLVQLTACPVLWPELEEQCIELANALASLPQSTHLQDVEVAYSRRDARAAARVRITGEIAPLRSALESYENLSGVEILSSGTRWQHGRLTLRYDHAKSEEYDLRFEPGVFTQAFPELNDVLVQHVVRAVRPHEHPKVLELHAGIGNFTIPIGRAGARVVAVEEVKRAAILNRRNCAAAGVSVDVRAIRDAEALEHLSEFDVLLMDPPRSGARVVAENIDRLQVERIVYVSCDPATLARDTAYLCEHGFAVDSIAILDMFPQTPHVETVLSLTR